MGDPYTELEDDENAEELANQCRLLRTELEAAIRERDEIRAAWESEAIAILDEAASSEDDRDDVDPPLKDKPWWSVYQPQRRDALEAIDKAWEKVDAICQGRERWTMSIPAQLDSDSDLVIVDALDKARNALTNPAAPIVPEAEKSAIEARIPEGWIHIDDRMPPAFTHVALCAEDHYENAPGVEENRVKAVGYLNNSMVGGYWSIMGERATDLRSFPWWSPLAPAPDADVEEGE